MHYTTSAENNITAIHETSNVSGNTVLDWNFTYDNNDRLTKSVVPTLKTYGYKRRRLGCRFLATQH
ncbi:MAG: hypothetical protein NTW85_00050 [Methylococcales bacterium]|nr:hypothetical protein [Methylococcales bacterium]